MSTLFRKLLVYQIFLLTPIVWYLDSSEKQISEFSSSLVLTTQHFKIEQFESIVTQNANYVFLVLIAAQFLFSILGLVLYKCLGSLGGFFYLLISVIKHNPLKEYTEKELIFGVKHELLLSLAAFLALIFVNSIEPKIEEKEDDQVVETKENKKKQTEKEGGKKTKEKSESSEKTSNSKKKKMD